MTTFFDFLKDKCTDCYNRNKDRPFDMQTLWRYECKFGKHKHTMPTEYTIRLMVEGGGHVDIPCMNKTEYDQKSQFLESNFPHLHWNETKVSDT